MSDVLFIKTSSMGDVVHHMPAVTEARRHRPDARIAWVVEEAFAPLVALHPGVDRIIPVASRRWRKMLWQPAAWREMRAFARTLRADRYDTIIDTQGLTRSALIARLARGERHGYDLVSVRERAAAPCYDVRHRVGRSLHAVARNRMLTGHALGYAAEGPPDFGLGLRPSHARNKAVLLHATARPQKGWSAEGWRALANALSRSGFELVLPSGNEAERAAGAAIAGGLTNVGSVRFLDRQPLDMVAREIADAAVVVGVDTGLLHLAAALCVPLVAIFVGASDPRLTGPIGAGPIEIVGTDGIPTTANVAAAIESVLKKAG